MRIALYARKSTEEDTRQVQSLGDQVRELTKLAKREGLTIVETFQESKSAKKPNNRPEFERMMDHVEKGRIDGILCWSINRLSRNPVDGGLIAYQLQTGKLALVQTFERKYHPEDNALLMSIENGMATAYLQDLSRNVKRGMRGRVERGWHTGKPPVGYKNDAESREIAVDNERFDLLRLGWDMLLSGGWTVTDVWKELAERELTVSTRRGIPQIISRVGLFHLFENPFYMGMVTYRSELFPGKHQPMVTPEEFRRAQVLTKRKLKKSIRKSFAFAQVFRCSNCGCAAIGEKRTKTFSGTGRTVEYIYYHCSAAKGCPKISIRQEDVVREFDKVAMNVQIPKLVGDWLQYASAEILEKGGLQDAQDFSNLDEVTKQEQSRLDKLTMMRADGELSAEEFSKMRSAILKKVHELTDTASRLRDASARLLNRAREMIRIGVQAGELQGGPSDPHALGVFARACGSHFLNLSQPELKIHPVLQKFATFEPLKDGSETPKIGDYVPSNSIWWTLVDDILNLLRDEDMQQVETSAQSHLNHLS